jgi:hypothetical protein
MGLKVSPSIVPRLKTMVPAALAQLTSEVIDDETWADALTRTFTVTAASGEADISTLLTQGLAPDALHLAELYHPSSPYQMEWMPDVTTLKLLAVAGNLGVAREGVKLYFSDIAGATGTLAGTVTIKAIGTPVTTGGTIDIPVRMESMLIESLVRLAMQKEQEGPDD